MVYCCIKKQQRSSSPSRETTTSSSSPSPPPPTISTPIHTTHNNNNSPSSEEDLSLVGVSVHHLSTTFLSEVRSAGYDEHLAKVYEIEEHVIRGKGTNVRCPIDNRLGAAYIHCLARKTTNNSTIEPPPPASRANLMLSYTWAYTIADILDTLLSHCESHNLNPQTTYVWICCLCINQHRVIEARNNGYVVPFEQFRSVFDGRVRNIGNVLAMMAPWHSPVYLTRVWCVFEMYTAASSGGNDGKNEVVIGMPSKEKKRFLEGIRRDDGAEQVNQLFRALAATDVMNAQASVEDDRVNILRMVEEGVGFSAFNADVSGLLRKWAIGVILEQVRDGSRLSGCLDPNGHDSDGDSIESVGNTEKQSEAQQGHLLNNVADLFRQIGETDRSLEMAQEALRINEAIHGRENGVTARSVSLLGTALYYKGKNDQGMELQNEALRIRERIFGRVHPDTADSIWWIARMLDYNGEGERNDEAMRLHKEALSIFETVYGREHEKTAESLYFISVLHKHNNELEEALLLLREVALIQEKVFGTEHADTANTIYHIAEVLFERDEKEEALKMYREALPVFEKVLGNNDPATLNTRQWIEIIMEIM